MAPPDTDPLIGSEILGYRIEALLGRGGMSVVYRAFDPSLNRKVAVKLLAPELSDDERFRARFLRESQLAASIAHPNIVPIYGAGELDGQLYIAMRYIEGSDLRDLLAREGRLSTERALAIGAEVADALDAAHQRGLVHRDVKPSNVLLDERGHAYLGDFGLTKSVGDPRGLTSPGEMIGTVAYVAPEQIRGDDIDGRADVYSLSCVLYECLTGEVPFRGSDLATVYAHLEEPPPLVTDGRDELPQAIDAVVAKGLVKTPAGRYPSCGELIEAARRALGADGLPTRRSRLPAVLAAALLLALAAGLSAYFATRGGESAGPVGELVRVDPASGNVGATVAVGSDPRAVAAGSGRVWIASFDDGTLWQVDPAAREARKIPAVGRPRDVVVYRGAAYVASDGPGLLTGNLSRYDALSGDRLGALEQLIVCGVSAGGAGLWIAGCPNAQQVSVTPFAVARTVVLPFQGPLTAANYREELIDLAVGEGGVWVLGDAADRRLWLIDPGRGRIAATIQLPFIPAAVAVGEGAVWVTAELDDVVARIDPANGHIVRAIPVGRGAAGVAAGGGSVWVANSLDGTVSRINPRTNAVSATIHVGGRPLAVAVGALAVWVGVSDAG